MSKSHFPSTRIFSFALRSLCLLAQLAIVGSAVAQAGTDLSPDLITTELSAQKIVLVKAADGSRIEKLESIANVVPGDAIRYTVAFTSKATEPIAGIVVSLPLPREMTLAEPVESTPAITATYSVDRGTHFAALNTLSVTDSGGRTRPANLADVNHVKWSISPALAPGASGTVSCRATLK